MVDKIEKTEEEWKAELPDDVFQVTRLHGTERPFTGEYNDCKDSGTYRCRCCGHPLFSSETKYDSGTGWPSFFQPIDEDAVETTTDRSLFMVRTEVHCAKCNAHLGHVFNDGPHPTFQRYCMNSLSLNLDRDAAEDAAE